MVLHLEHAMSIYEIKMSLTTLLDVNYLSNDMKKIALFWKVE